MRTCTTVHRAIIVKKGRKERARATEREKTFSAIAGYTRTPHLAAAIRERGVKDPAEEKK